MGAPRASSVSAFGRLGDGAAPWFGIEASESGCRLVFGEANGRLTPAHPAEPQRATRDLLLALAAYFEGEAGEPPPELEATQSDAAAVLRWLIETCERGSARALPALRRALDAIDDGMPPDVVVAELYEAMGADSLGERPRPGVSSLEELLERYRSVEGVS